MNVKRRLKAMNAVRAKNFAIRQLSGELLGLSLGEAVLYKMRQPGAMRRFLGAASDTQPTEHELNVSRRIRGLKQRKRCLTLHLAKAKLLVKTLR